MPEVSLSIGGRTYAVHCGEGEEAHISRLAAMVDEKTGVARQASPGLTEVRQLLFAAILLADEIHDLRAKGNVGQGSLELAPSAPNGEDAAAVARINVIAARIESLTEKLAGTDTNT